jgi:hypothetical protein
MANRGRNAALIERDLQIADAVIRDRRTLDNVGRQFGLTRERVRQIIERDHPDYDIRSANKADTAARAATRRAQAQVRQHQWREKVSDSGGHVERGWTEEKMIANLRALAEEVGHSPSIKEWIAGRHQPSSALYLQRFGSWNDAKVAAGLPLNRTARQHYVRAFSDEDLIEAVAQFLRTDNPRNPLEKFGAYQYDRWRKEMVKAGFSYPSLSLIRVRLGAWQDVKHAAIEKNALRSSNE